jgi:hypothetical protein
VGSDNDHLDKENSLRSSETSKSEGMRNDRA